MIAKNPLVGRFWEGRGACVAFASLALAAIREDAASMATLEKRSGCYRVIFYFDGQRFARSLKTDNTREAVASIARLDDNLRRIELGLLACPEDVDLASFLLSDGRAEAKHSVPTIRTISQLCQNYFQSIPADAIEDNTRRGMKIHIKHLERILGRHFPIQALAGTDLQRYIEQRSYAKGMHGRKLSAATIKKELITLRTVWNWSLHMGIVKRPQIYIGVVGVDLGVLFGESDVGNLYSAPGQSFAGGWSSASSYRDVRMHLDDEFELGAFLTLQIILSVQRDEYAALTELNCLRTELGLGNADPRTPSYSDQFSHGSRRVLF
jgi:hypothetical protein